MKTSDILKFFMAAAAALMLASCDDGADDSPYTTKGKTALADPSNIEITVYPKKAVISWDPVTGADQYYYELRNTMHYIVTKGYTTETSVTIGSLSTLTDYSFSVKSIPSADYASSTCASESVSCTFTTADPGLFIWEVTGKISFCYTSDDDGNDIWDDSGRTTTLSCDTSENPDGNYALSGWYGNPGVEIMFTVNDDSTISFLENDSSAFYWADYPNYAYSFYTNSSKTLFSWLYDYYAWFEGDENGGSIEIWGWLASDTTSSANWGGYKVEW